MPTSIKGQLRRRAVLALTASAATLVFVAVLPPGAGEIAVASASVQTVDSAGPMPLPPGTPAPVAQDFATAMQTLQSALGNGDDVTPSDDDDDFDTTQQEEQDEQAQQQQDDSDQLQNQLNTMQLNNEEMQQQSEEQAQEQNDEAQQQVDDGLQQAQQDEIDAGQ
jgi:hypothetical protein